MEHERNVQSAEVAPHASPIVPALCFCLDANDAKTSRTVLNEVVKRIQGIRLRPGSVLKEYEFSYRIYDPQDEKYASDFKLSLNQINFQEYGFWVELVKGVLTIGGANDSKPKLPYDGPVEVTLDVSLKHRITISKLFDEPIPSNNEQTRDIKIKINHLRLQSLYLSIAPDPQTLWKELPTDSIAPFWKPDSESFSRVLETERPLKILAASRRGRSHANEGKFRDDHFAIKTASNPGGWTIATVADGAGSAQFSREGSKLACEAFVESLSTNLDKFSAEIDSKLLEELDAKKDWRTNLFVGEDFISTLQFDRFFYRAAYCAYMSIDKASKERAVKNNAFNTTLICVALKHFESTDARPAFWAIASYWIGDGGAAIFRPNGYENVVALGTPDSGEFAGQTRFITMREEMEEAKVRARVKLYLVEDFQALVLMSDGLTDPFFPAENNLADYNYWNKFWTETLPAEFPGVIDSDKSLEEREQALLKGLDFFVAGNHDDRTLLFILDEQCELKKGTLFNETEEECDDKDSDDKNCDEEEMLSDGPVMIELPNVAQGDEPEKTNAQNVADETGKEDESIQAQDSDDLVDDTPDSSDSLQFN